MLDIRFCSKIPDIRLFTAITDFGLYTEMSYILLCTAETGIRLCTAMPYIWLCMVRTGIRLCTGIPYIRLRMAILDIRLSKGKVNIWLPPGMLEIRLFTTLLDNRLCTAITDILLSSATPYIWLCKAKRVSGLQKWRISGCVRQRWMLFRALPDIWHCLSHSFLKARSYFLYKIFFIYENLLPIICVLSRERVWRSITNNNSTAAIQVPLEMIY